MAASSAFASAGTFEQWIGEPVGWVSNDAERATLTKKVDRFRATLPGHARTVTSGEPEFEIWIKIGCRARNPAEPPTGWIQLTDHPEQPPAPHWASDPLDFVYTLLRYGEFETTPVTMRAGGDEAPATVIRHRVVAWTGSKRPWLTIEFGNPEETAITLLEMIASESGPETIALSGAGTRIGMHLQWSAAEGALARDMRKHCPTK